MTDTAKPDDQNTEMVGTALVHVPGRGLVMFDADALDHDLGWTGLEHSQMLPCFVIRGREWIHFYSAVVGEDVAERLRSEKRMPAPLSFSIQGGALLIEHKDEGFVRAYGAGSWERVCRVDEEFIHVEEEGPHSVE